ncbi:MAG: vanadium-dependent haloperoxidase [Thermoanaerobaculia bacterium]|nr:vanadium-dependent haloperoxidase [Thermoanaerobaculia bacterium]
MSRTFLAVVALTLSIASIAHADAVVDWNAIASQVISAGGRPGPSTLVDFAVVHAAIYDAVQSIERRYKPYCVVVPDATGSTAAAAAKAARDVLVKRFPSQSGTIDTQYNAYLASNGLAIDDPGISVGAQAAAAVIALRANDGAFPTTPQVPFTGGGEPGMWRPTPSYLTGNPAAFSPMAAPWLAKVTPFAVKSTSQFRAKEPPALTSDEYTRDYNEVKAMGAMTGSSRTQEQTEIGYFWSDNTPVQWHRALRGISAAYVDDIGDSARLFALASFAAADAIMTCWDTKLHYNYWRPVTAIQEAAGDGNPNTEPDLNWKPMLNTPNYPDYSSGANNVTAAMTRTMQLFFGTDEMTFTVTSNVQSLPADKRTRTFSRFSDAAMEVVDARIYLGFHFRFADTAAREQGLRVAKWTFTHVLKPIDDEVRSPSLSN